jgi:methylenetetrahydrofolate dehydrogenase (NADP+) / methenyltetrahydrofolate cyclohydrolase
MGRVIDGKATAQKVRTEVQRGVASFVGDHGRPPGLTAVLVGDDPASARYVASKEKASAEVGIRGQVLRRPGSIGERELIALVDSLNADPSVDGILVQLPLPPHIDTARVTHRIDPAKDVDGLHPDNLGLLLAGSPRLVPCTPLGCMRLLEEAGVEVAGKRAVVLGRSNIVGKPVSVLLLHRHATVTLCHSRTRDLADEVSRAEIVVAAIGKAELVRGEWIRPGAAVIDVGMNRSAEGKLVGDVDFAGALPRAGAITPVPGGVGPMTVAYLLHNTLQAARARVSSPASAR